MKKILILFLILIAAIVLGMIWLHDTPPDTYQKIFAVGSTVCHQIPSHSFQSPPIQFPLCARCAGLYLGSFIGLGYFFTQGKKSASPPKAIMLFLAALFLLWAGDGLNSFISDFRGQPFLYQTSNVTRLITGFGMGLTMSTALATLFNITIWKDSQNTAILGSPWQVIGYLALSTALGTVLISSKGNLFSLLAYISIGTVIVIISMLYTIFWVIMTRKEMQFTTFRPLGIYLLAGFGTAVGQILLLYFLRQSLLG